MYLIFMLTLTVTFPLLTYSTIGLRDIEINGPSHYEPRLNHGLLFEQLAVVENSNTYFQHIFIIDLLPLPPVPPKLQNPCRYNPDHNTTGYYKNNLEMCTLFDLLFQTYDQQSSFLYKDIESNLHTITTVLQKHKIDTSRTKRGLLDPIGHLYSWAFGLVTRSELEKFISTIEALDKTIHTIGDKHNLLADDLISFIALQNNKTSQLLQRIELNYQRTETLQANLRNLRAAIQGLVQEHMGLYEKYLHATFTLITQRLTSLQYYQVQTIEFLQHVQLLITGKISPRFIEAATIEKLYEDIQRDLNKHYPTFFITNTDVSAFYNTPYFIYYTLNQRLFIQVRIPLSSYKATFQVYQVHRFPLPVHNNATTTFTSYTNLPDYFALSLDRNYFMELSSMQYGLCDDKSDIRHCVHNLPIRILANPTCAVAIFYNDLSAITNLCEKSLLLYVPPKLQIIALGGNSYFFIDTLRTDPHWTLVCDQPKNNKLLPPCSLCTVVLPCSCSLQGKDFILAKSLYSCESSPLRSSSEIVTNFHLNINFLASFLYNTSVLDTLSPQAALSHLPSISMPDFFETLPIIAPEAIEAEQTVEINLKRLVNRIQEHKMHDIPYIRNLRQDFSRFSDFYFWLHIIHCIFDVFVVIIIFVLIRFILRLRFLTNMILLSTAATKIPAIHSFTLSSDLQPRHTVHIEYVLFPPASVYIVCLVLSLFTTLTFILFCYNLCQQKAFLTKPMAYFSNKNHHISTELLLELSTAEQSVVIPISTIAAHYTQVDIANASITINNLITGFCITNYLRVNWGNTLVSVPNRFNNISLPDMLPVSFTIKNLLKNILNNSHIHITLLFGSNGIYLANRISTSLYPNLNHRSKLEDESDQ